MKAYNITKLTVELKSSDNVRTEIIQKNCFHERGSRKHIDTVKSNLSVLLNLFSARKLRPKTQSDQGFRDNFWTLPNM